LRSDGDGYQTRDLVFVKDVARANRLAAESEHDFRGHALNVGSGRSISNNEIIDLFRLKFPNVEVNHAPERPGDVRDTLADISITKQVLGWEPQVHFDEGLNLTFEWWGLNGTGA
jgi:UDP-glucose 4-epimerase